MEKILSILWFVIVRYSLGIKREDIDYTLKERGDPVIFSGMQVIQFLSNSWCHLLL